MNGYHDKMVLSARNSQILSHVTELATSLQRHPRDVVLPFFKRIAEEQYRKGFEEAVAGFASRIENRAVEKRKEMDAAKAAEGRGAEPDAPRGVPANARPKDEAAETSDAYLDFSVKSPWERLSRAVETAARAWLTSSPAACSSACAPRTNSPSTRPRARARARPENWS